LDDTGFFFSFKKKKKTSGFESLVKFFQIFSNLFEFKLPNFGFKNRFNLSMQPTCVD
jgi:hypothetical protein